ncbi:hypothetical protein X781_860 [Mannheimia sp. USDA-ARS-USMARC-1261]|nr:hypothetical protein X781_860 [Mannheimia sp. USDA-ARS-USMARC-1261]
MPIISITENNNKRSYFVKKLQIMTACGLFNFKIKLNKV